MPLYIFKNPKSGKVKEVIQKMNDVHEYSENGIKWERVFTSPMAIVDGKISAHSAQEFVEKTRNKKGTMKDLWDLSAELSEKRGGGLNDPVKRKNYREFEKAHGKKHPDEKRAIQKQKSVEKLKKAGITLVD